MRKLISAISVLALGLSLSVVSTNSASAVVDASSSSWTTPLEGINFEVCGTNLIFVSGKLTIKISSLENKNNSKQSIDLSTASVKIVDTIYGGTYVGSLNGKASLSGGLIKGSKYSVDGRLILNRVGDGKVISAFVKVNYVENSNGQVVVDKDSLRGFSSINCFM